MLYDRRFFAGGATGGAAGVADAAESIDEGVFVKSSSSSLRRDSSDIFLVL
jgi:hypothetical protein